jgi:Stage II sporulation protein E (SpoIIE)/GAF domain
MPPLSLRSLLSRKSASLNVMRELLSRFETSSYIADADGRVLLGEPPQSADVYASRTILQGESVLGSVVGPDPQSTALAALLSHLADRESEQRALASETLTLYRELHLIEQLTEELAALLQTSAISTSALEQAKRLIPATHGAVYIRPDAAGALEASAAFCESNNTAGEPAPFLEPESQFVASVLERGVAEIVNGCADDPRASGAESDLRALVLAPLRTGQTILGVIALANSASGEPYSAANLKLLNTIALQTATAIRNAVLCAQMVETASARAAYAAELQAASSVQQMLLQTGSRPTPGFKVDSVYLPASEVGGDFFFVQPAADGSLLATIGDVSGKGLTAAMRVSMILGALRREASDDPSQILFNLNNVLATQEQLGFTTACSVRVYLSGEFVFANAGHIAPYLSGVEMNSNSALPLGIVPNQVYSLVHGAMQAGDQIVLISDGVPEARSGKNELLGFDRLAELTQLSAREIANAAQSFGQEDDITVLTLKLAQ